MTAISTNDQPHRVGQRRAAARPGAAGRHDRDLEGSRSRRSGRGVNLDGDDQADRRVHGGPTKAIYAY
jgi:MOSC domain-containing protein YiiM